MIYENIKSGRFISRPNRFIANVDIDGEISVCHVKNTGRCKELLTENAKVFVQEFHSDKRKTNFDLISVYKGDRLINMDSQVPNKAVMEFLPNIFTNITLIKPEAVYKNSRFDFYLERENTQNGEKSIEKIFVEVKGVTLENSGVALFPDAPTIRGVKHINELMDCVDNGFSAYIIFVVQMSNILYFTPNIATHKEFGDALVRGQQHGVNILAFDSIVTENSINLNNPVKIVLN